MMYMPETMFDFWYRWLHRPADLLLHRGGQGPFPEQPLSTTCKGHPLKKPGFMAYMVSACTKTTYHTADHLLRVAFFDAMEAGDKRPTPLNKCRCSGDGPVVTEPVLVGSAGIKLCYKRP